MNTLDKYQLIELSSEEMQELNGGSIPGSSTAEQVGYVIGHATAAVVNAVFTFLVPWV